MASGRPVLALKRGGALETVIEGKTGHFFASEEPISIARAVKNFHGQDFDPEFIRQHASQFSEDNFRQEIKNFIEREYKKFRNDK